MPAVALTDHGAMFGVIDFYNTAKAAGVKPIIGIETYLAPRSRKEKDPQADKKSTHLLLLAENDTGYKNLLKLASAAQLEGFYYYPRIDHELLAQHAEGLICTTGCMSAEIPRLIQQDNLAAARRQMDWYYEVFGPDHYFLELQDHDLKELDRVNQVLLELGKRYQAHFIATNDVHYIRPEDARLQDIMLAIQTGSVLSDPNRMRMSNNTYYLRTPQEMAALFSEIPEALTNTLWIAERCQVDLGFKGYHLPDFPVPEGFTAETYLRHLAEEGCRRRYGLRANDPDVCQRLDYELKVIHEMGFDTYFLIVWDLCRYAREAGIWYNARGSAAGSVVAYSLDITLVEPIKFGLIFERFLNPGRISMPDIDLDFRDDRRAEMFEYTVKKYGDDRVAQIITFGTLGARAAIRDVGRVMDIPLNEVDRVAKLIPNIPGKPVTIQEALAENSELRAIYESADYLKELIDTASQVEGVIRNAGTHAAGVVITDKPIIEYLPLHRPTGQTAEESPIKMVTQFEMNVVADSLGLLKVDFLGLATLTIMARACELISRRHGVHLNLYNIPTDDPATFELLGRGDTAGVFQVEGSGMRRWLMEMKPKHLDNVIAMVALFRPGPMDFIPGYIRRLHGEEAVSYKHPALEPIFKETYGYPVYQEQLMFAVMQLAGYSPSDADDLRKAVAKKIKEKLLKHREKFIKGAVAKGIPEKTAGEIFDEWEEFARYGFNKAHAADYGVIAVQTAYLKAHYPVEYMTALLSVNQQSIDKVALYVADCRRMGIDVLPPDINSSEWDFSIEDDPGGKSRIRFGLGAVKNVGHGPVEAILNARAHGPFKDINDLARRVDLRQVGRRALESLIKVGALDSLGPRTALLTALDRILSISAAHFRAADVGQMSLFGLHTGVMEEIILPKVSVEISRREILNWERELIGLYVSDHPLSPVIDVLTRAVTHFSGQLAEANPNDKVRVAGMITRVRPHQTKTGKVMGFVTLEDIQGNIELVIFPRTWEKVWEIIEPDRIILVDGRLDAQSGEPKVLVDSITTELTTYEAVPVPLGSDLVQNVPFLLDEEDTASGASADEPIPASAEQFAPEAPGNSDQSANPFADKHDADQPNPTRIRQVSEGAGEAIPSEERSPMPPPPEAFPPDWEELYEIVPGGFVIDPPELSTSKDLSSVLPQAEVPPPVHADLQPPVQSKNAFETPEQIALQASTANIDQIPTETIPDPTKMEGAEIDQDAELAPLPYLVSPIPPHSGEEIHMITVLLRPTGDKVRDGLRLRQVYGTLISYPGNDRFAFLVYEGGRGFQIEFPNFTTGLNPELLHRLYKLVGPENVRTEPIKFQ